MSLISNIVINSYSAILLLIIYVYSLKSDEKETFQHQIYMIILQVAILLLIVDVFGRLDGKPDTLYFALNHIANFLLFALNCVLASLWLMYVYYQVYKDVKKTKKLILPLITINMLNVAIIVLNLFYHWFYYIDESNTYHRAPYFALSASFIIIILIFAYTVIIKERKNINKVHYYTLLFFAVPPSICIILQIFIYGISLSLNGVTISLLIVFINIQNQSVSIDHLTKANNRKSLDAYIKEKVNTSTPNNTFSAIMADMDNFKTINDTFGHDVGDNVLKAASKLLKTCAGSKGFVARYGGDEFYIILDICDINALEKIIRSIDECFIKFNKTSNMPCKLDLSMGYAVYDYNLHMSVEEFEKHLDILMYQKKRVKQITEK